VLDNSALPHVSVLIAAHNEESVIEDRIRNALALDYPQEKIEVLIASDGSTDRTDEIVRSFAGTHVKLLDYPVRRGKAAVLNDTMPRLRGEIVILSDANTHTESDAARALVRWFNDPKVDVVCGRLVLNDTHHGNNSDGLYWKYETFLKKNESKLGALLGTNGAIYAIRADRFVPIPNNTIIDDFVIPLAAKLRYGSRIVYDQKAVAYEESSPTIHGEFRRRARIGAGGWQAIMLLWGLLNPLKGWVSFTFFSHKILRWICPFLLIGALVLNLVEIDDRPYQWLLLVQLALYAIALIGLSIPGQSRPARVARLASMFISMNAALLVGFLRWMQGPQTGMWNRTRRWKELQTDVGSLVAGGARLLTPWDYAFAAAMVAAAVLAMHDTWQNLFTISYLDEELSYVLLTPVVIAWLVWVRRDRLQGARARPEWLGLPIIIFGWLVHWYGFIYDPAIWRAGAVIVAVGAFVTVAGRDLCRRMAPALAAAVFLIPIDPTGRIHFAGPLEVVTAQTTQSVCDIIGMSVDRAGNLLSVNGTGIAVAEACNGMRMVLSLFLVCYVVAFSYPFKNGVRFLLLATSPLVSIASNVVRLVPTVWVFSHFPIDTAERFHAISGWVMTFVAFLFLMGLTHVFRVVWDAVAAIELSPSESDSFLRRGRLTLGA
jgi:exosortase